MKGSSVAVIHTDGTFKFSPKKANGFCTYARQFIGNERRPRHDLVQGNHLQWQFASLQICMTNARTIRDLLTGITLL